MRSPCVVFSARLPSPARAALARAGCDVVEPADGAFGRDRLLSLLGEADALIALLSDRVDAALFDAAPRLRVVANYAVGVNNVDLAEATRRRVLVTNTPDVLTDATADLAFGLLLAAARRFGEGERLVRSGAWRGWAPELLLGAQVCGATLGLVGFGRIGRAVARRALGFDMRVLYHAPVRAPVDVERQLRAERVPLDELLERADFVSLHVPLTEATHHLIGARELARMKPGAVLVNTARGPVVDEEALAAALAGPAGSNLGGCGLDVYEREPKVHAGLVASPRAILLPHLGSATRVARERMAEMAATGVLDALAGRVPPHLVNPGALP